MNQILKLFLSMSFSGSLLILFLLLGKRFLKDKINRQWQYYIWAVVVLRCCSLSGRRQACWEEPIRLWTVPSPGPSRCGNSPCRMLRKAFRPLPRGEERIMCMGTARQAILQRSTRFRTLGRC